MSIQIQSALDALKRQSLQVILENVYLKSPHMKDVLSSYVHSGKSIFESMMNFISFNNATFSSDFINSSMLLAYMDFYTIYSITYANYDVFDSLKNISNSKYNYMYNLYKDSYSLLKEKSFSADYKFIRYCNFGFPKEINILKSRTNIRGNAVSDILSLDGLLTLPVLSSQELNASSVSFEYIDSSNHTTEQDIGNDYIDFDILRAHSEKLGMLKLSDPNYIVHRYEGEELNTSGYSGVPELSGTVYGHFSKEIHIIVDKLVLDEDDVLKEIYIKGSSNGYDWSTSFVVLPGVMTPIMIERDVLIGLSIKLSDGLGIAVADRWIISLHDVTIEDPIFFLKAGFGGLDIISYVKFNEVSPYPLSMIEDSAYISRMKFDGTRVIPFVYNNRISHFMASNGPINTSSIGFIQRNYDIASRNGSLFHKYSCRINDIKGVVAKYKSHGGISLNSLDVTDIGTITVSSDNYVPKSRNIHSIEDPYPAASFIEYNVFAQNAVGRVMIPVLDKDVINKNRIVASFPSFKSLTTDPVSADKIGLTDGALLYSESSKRYWRFNGTTERIDYYPEFKEFLIGSLIKTPTKIYVLCDDYVLRRYVDNSNSFIPMIFEYVLPDKTSVYTAKGDVALVSYSQRFPVDNKYKLDVALGKFMKAYSVMNREEAQVSHDNTSGLSPTGLSLIYDYKLRLGYCLWYPFKIHSMIETVKNELSSNWIHAGANIYYMYFLDESNSIHVAIRTNIKGSNVLSPFTGTLEPSIEIRSLDQPNVTPFIFDYALLAV